MLWVQTGDLRRSIALAMNDPIIVSVPHTGTRFLQERLGVKDYVHTICPWDALLERVKDRQVISPLRNPSDVWKSWARRKNPKTEPFPYALFIGAWHVLHTLDMMMDVDFICVDKCSDPRIKDWEPVGNRDYGPYDLKPIDLRSIFWLPFVNKHYGSWQK